jgi:ribose-phosphate pyrophosphokinase
MHITLVAPYLAYMRQDTAFNPGEAVSQRLVGEFLAGLVDALVCVDPHLHRVSDLAQVLPGRQAVALSSAATMGRFLRERQIQALLLGPDVESRQWVSTLAEAAGLTYAVASKVRAGDRSVTVTLPEQDVGGRDVVIVDDVISTGVTVAEAARLLRAAGARSVRCLVTHALFAAGAEERLAKAGVDAIWSSDSIAHASNAVALAACLGEAVREQLSR